MKTAEFADLVGPALARALEKKGYDQLTPVQAAVLDPAVAGRDLRISSQTGSGKTLAIGFALRELVETTVPTSRDKLARPRALVVTPTRELAKQVEQELSWLYAELPGLLSSATGGASYRDEMRALAKSPAVVVGTPGRLLDHMRRGAISGDDVRAVVLDEADRMLDLGFREDIETILKLTPKERRTHLVSATFARDVRALADRVQRDPAHVQGTQLGAANVDIDHVLHLVDPRQRVDAVINLLLANPGEQTLVFVRTRADVADIARELAGAGFAASSLSGEMEQAARNRALAAFKSGALRVLVATDVAARGIDVTVGRVIHAEPPTNADAYTHRSGRTGRAGRKGTSSLLVSPAAVVPATRVLRNARVAHRFEPIPSAEQIRLARDERFFAELTADDPEGAEETDPRSTALAQRLIAHGQIERTVARLLSRARHGGETEPREVRTFAPMQGERPGREQMGAPRGGTRPQRRGGEFVPFRVSWGAQHGAEPRRLLAMACRRGGIRGTDVGAIRVERTFSVVEVASDVATGFGQRAGKPDPREPRVTIRPDRGAPSSQERTRPPVKKRGAPFGSGRAR